MSKENNLSKLTRYIYKILNGTKPETHPYW